jgi:hypothetical protein
VFKKRQALNQQMATTPFARSRLLRFCRWLGFSNAEEYDSIASIKLMNFKFFFAIFYLLVDVSVKIFTVG